MRLYAGKSSLPPTPWLLHSQHFCLQPAPLVYVVVAMPRILGPLSLSFLATLPQILIALSAQLSMLTFVRRRFRERITSACLFRYSISPLHQLATCGDYDQNSVLR